MKPIALALCVAAAATTAQAQTAEERGSARHAPASRQAQAPSPVSALIKWLHDKSNAAPAKAADKAAPAPAPAKVAEKPKPAPAKTEVRRQEVKQQEARQQEARQQAVRRHRAKAADEADAAPPVITMTVAAAPRATQVEDPPAAMYHTAAAGPVAAPSAPAVPTPPAVTRALAVAPAATADPPRDPAMPRAVATLTVTRPTVQAPPERPGGYHSCSSGERIITAFYWEGKHTASGEPFDPDGFTAAHRTYAFGTKLLVFNPRNGKSVTVRVNDRGPFVKGVTLDLSRGAAKAIGMQGTGAVCIAKL
jgi:rare lipoprotein A